MKEKPAEDFSVLVVDIPTEYRSNAALFVRSQAIEKSMIALFFSEIDCVCFQGLFDSMYPGKVHCATVVPDTMKLRKLISSAKALRNEIEKGAHFLYFISKFPLIYT